MWVVVKIRIPFWVLTIIRHLVFRVPKRDHNFDNNYPCSLTLKGLNPLSPLSEYQGRLALDDHGRHGRLLLAQRPHSGGAQDLKFSHSLLLCWGSWGVGFDLVPLSSLKRGMGVVPKLGFWVLGHLPESVQGSRLGGPKDP